MNKDDKQSIYEIYRACRLCGAGAGYKMPIIQSVIDVDGGDTELKLKIRECVQLEVNLNDRMPPLICELCVDKINDFFEFRAMCHEVNKKTRMRLGLPLQTVPGVREPAETEDCILGVTETVYTSDSDEGKPLSGQTSAKSKPKPKSVKMKNDGDVKIKIESYQPILKERLRSSSPDVIEPRELRRRQAPTPKRATRQTSSDELSLSVLQGMQILQKPTTRSRPGPKSVVKIERERQEAEMEIEMENEIYDNNSLLVPRPKRPREKEIINYGIEIPLPAKKVKLAPEPPKTEKVSKPGPKFTKTILKPPPQQPPPTTKAGPKSKKREPSPVQTPKSRKSEPAPGPKSRKSEPSPVPTPGSRKSEPAPGPKSKKSESSSVPGPKSRKSEPSPVPGPRSRKSEPFSVPGPKPRKCEPFSVPGPKSRKSEPSPVPTPTPKSRRRESSPASTSKSQKREHEEAPKLVDRTSPQPQKGLTCSVCGIKAKAIQGLTSHVKSHVPTFTPVKLSCNACELWFASGEEAARHHARHGGAGAPYACAKCYGAFRTRQDYELHFSRDQCLPTYEVPDVKCEECWLMFPTYKLLEDHKCNGEGSRPGGKCAKCKRVYASLKSLTAHEMKCTYGKKKGEPIVDPKVSRRLLPMQVRIAKCDALLKNPTDEGYDVSGISHRFGLDRNFSYPYLYSMGDLRVKTEPSIDNFDQMVSIKDEIKEEYFNDDNSFVHWDSDASADSDNETSFDTSKNKVDTLSRISLKTIFSPKLLGKVPRTKRKHKPERGFASILSIDFPKDIRRNIDSIIDNLGNDSHHSDNYDSDSILEKKTDQNNDSEVDTFDILKAYETNSIAASKSATEDAKETADRDKGSDKSDSPIDLVNNHPEHSKEDGNISRNVKLTKTVSDVANSDSCQSEHTSHLVENVNRITNNTNSDETTGSNSLQKSSGVSNATDNLELKDIQNNNDNEFKDDSKKGHERNSSENLPSPIEEQVEISAPQTEPEKMDVDEQIEPKPTNGVDINPTLTDIGDVETNELGKEKQPRSTENKIDVNTEKDNLKSSNYKVMENLNDVNNDSKTSEAVSCRAIADSNTINNDSPSFDATSYKDLNDDKNYSISSDATSRKTIGDLNDEKNDLQSSIMTNQKNHSDKTKVGPEYDTVDDVGVLENDFMHKTCDESSVPNSFNAMTEDDNLAKNVQIADKFNINDLNEEEKQLMAELDEQIGENQPRSDLIGGGIRESGMIGENRPDNCVIGENRSDNGVIGENRPDNGVIGETRQDNGVIGENGVNSVINQNRLDNSTTCKNSEVFDRKKSSSVVIGNVNFSDINDDKKVDTLDTLMQKHDDLKSLELDNISDEEFDFDL